MQQPLEFVDAHAHFWDPPRLPYPWLSEVPGVAGTHDPGHLRAEAGDRMPREIVFVQAGCDRPLDEVRWIEELAAEEPRITGIVAFSAMDRGVDTVNALAQLCRRPLIRGIRHLIQGETDPQFCLRPAFVEGIRRLGEIGLSFDLCIRHQQLPAATELVRRCPATAFVLDHAGKPGIKNGLIEPWRDDIARLAELPNVDCKLSGLITEADPDRWSPAQLRPYVDRLVAVFGAGRLAFGSDWPLVKLGSDYRGWLATAEGLLSSLTDAERSAVFFHNARRIYRLPLK